MKRIFNIFFCLFVALSFVAVSCDKAKEGQEQGGQEEEGGQGGGGEDTPGHISKPLLTLWDEVLATVKTTGTRDRIFIVAHRGNTVAGANAYLPENSIPAVEMAIAKGADMVEIDIRPTKDYELVCCHDATINATTNGRGTVAEMTYEEICQYDMRRGSKIYKDADGNTIKMPTLKEMLLACKDKIYVNLDIAGKNVPVSRCVRIIQECEMENQVMVYVGGNYSLANEFQFKDATIAVHPQISSADGIATFSSLPGAKLYQYNNTIYLSENPNIGKQVHAAGALSYSNLLDNYDTQIKNGNYSALDKFIASESDYVQTDVFELVDAYLREKGLRKGSPIEPIDPDQPVDPGTAVEGSVVASYVTGKDWPEGAKIGIWTADDNNMEFTLASSTGNKGGFNGLMTEDSPVIAAYYPYQEDLFDMTDIPVIIPTEVTVGEDIPIFAVAQIKEDGELQFIEKTATLKIIFKDFAGTAYDGKEIKSVSVSSSYRKLFGTYAADASYPTRALAATEAMAAATLNFPEGTTISDNLEAMAAIAPIAKANDEYAITIELVGETLELTTKLTSSVSAGDTVELEVSGEEFIPSIRMEWGLATGARFAGQYPAVDAEGNVYYTLNEDTKLYKVSPQGELLWSEEIGFTGNQRTSPAIEADGSVIYATGGSGGTGCVRAFNPDGSAKWTLTSDKFFNKGNTPAPNFNFTTPAVGPTCVYIGNAGSTGTVLSVNKTTGERVAYVSNADGSSGPAGGAYTGVSVSKAGVVSWAASYGLFAASQAELDNPSNTHETFGAYVPWGLRSGYNWNSGQPWNKVSPNMGIACSSFDGHDYLVFGAVEQTSSGTYNLRLFWEDASQGLGTTAPGLTQSWLKVVTVSNIGKQDQGGIVIGPRGEAIVSLKKDPTTGNGGIVAYFPDGTKAYEFSVGTEDVGGAAAVDNNGNIHVIADWTGDYFIVKPDYETHTCEIVAQVKLLDAAKKVDSSVASAERIRFWSSVIIGDDGKMYVGGTAVQNSIQSGYLMCLSYPGVTGPGQTSWPMRGADARHSGVQKK